MERSNAAPAREFYRVEKLVHGVWIAWSFRIEVGLEQAKAVLDEWRRFAPEEQWRLVRHTITPPEVLDV